MLSQEDRPMRPTTVGMIAILAGSTLWAQAPPSPTLLVLNKGDATLSIIDPTSGNTVGTVKTGAGPHELAVSRDGKTAFASNYWDRAPGTSLSVIDLAARRERRVELTPFKAPHGLFVSEGKVYFTAEANRAIGSYDPASGKVERVVTTGQDGTHMVLATADGTILFASNVGDDSVTIAERSAANPSRWRTTTVRTGQGPEGFDLSPDGRELWVAHSGDGGVSIIDTAARKVTARFDIGTKRSNRLKFTPDGRHVLVSDLDAGDLVVIDAHARTVTKRLPLGAEPEGVLIVPDGSRAYVAVSGDDHLAVVDLASFEITGTVATGRGPDGMAWIK
jgi:YVTN family beta-propeller protein